MDSRIVLAFRIFVMLCCLIIVPMAAIFGSAFPDVVKGVLVDRIVYWATGNAPEANREHSPDGFGTVAPADQQDARPDAARPSDAPRWDNPTAATSWPTQPAGAIVPAAAVLVDPAGGSQQAAYIGPAPADQVTSGSVYSSGPPGVATSVAPHAEGAAAGAFEPAAAADGSLAQPDPFTAMERKLREYGATYYLLETWGNDSKLFRFHCKMAIGNNPNYTRHFEATDRDALRAMKQVLDRVESWRSGRPQ